LKKQFLYIGIIIIIIIIALILGTYFSKPKDDEIKIGLVIPITGNTSYLGDNQKNAFEIALSEYNKDPTHKQNIKLIYEDSAGAVQQGVSGINKLITIDNINYAVISTTPIVGATSPQIKENKIPSIIIAPTMSPSSRNEYMYNFFSYSKDSAELIANDLMDKNISPVYVIAANNDSGIEFTTAFSRIYKGEYTIEMVSTDQQDLRTEILKGKGRGANAIVFSSFPGHSMLLLNQLLKLNIIIPTYVTFANADIVNNGAKEALNEIQPYSGWFMLSQEKYSEFISKYKLAYNKIPYADGAYAYNAAKIMFEVIDKCGADKVCFNKTIMVTEFKGGLVRDFITFDVNRNAITGASLIKYDSNKEEWVYVK
jgi:branched-chain amino acid transport system substrate-binding protein